MLYTCLNNYTNGVITIITIRRVSITSVNILYSILICITDLFGHVYGISLFHTICNRHPTSSTTEFVCA